MWVAVKGCNISVETGSGGAQGGVGGLDILVRVVSDSASQQPPAARPTAPEAQCGRFLPNTDWPGHDLRKIPHVASQEACCELCANMSTCAGGSWDGPHSRYASSATCNLKTATPSAGKVSSEGMVGFVVRAPAPAPAPGCAGLALVPIGLTTWFRDNTVTAIKSSATR
jgi:hypothetical protein